VIWETRVKGFETGVAIKATKSYEPKALNWDYIATIEDSRGNLVRVITGTRETDAKFDDKFLDEIYRRIGPNHFKGPLR